MALKSLCCKDLVEHACQEICVIQVAFGPCSTDFPVSTVAAKECGTEGQPGIPEQPYCTYHTAEPDRIVIFRTIKGSDLI